MSDQGLRLAVWSGPRNISTAMMRSWGNRPDTAVWDEPFYAYYLKQTGLAHPGADEVMAHHEADWKKVVARITGPIPDGRTIFYQKNMAHHLLPEIDRSWMEKVTHVFLIREPREMLTSLIHQIPEPTLADTGLRQQVEIFRRVHERSGRIPPVLDARDVLEAPRRLLGALCEALGSPFLDAMLKWPPGPRATDGIWAPHWYGAVEQSTEFKSYKPKPDRVPEQLTELHAQCDTYYAELYGHRLNP